MATTCVTTTESQMAPGHPLRTRNMVENASGATMDAKLTAEASTP